MPPLLQASGGHFYVVLENISNDPIWLATIDDIWFDNLSFEITDTNGKTTSYHAAHYAVAPHLVAFKLLRPKEVTVVEISYGEDGAEGAYAFPFPKAGGSNQASIRAIFDKAPDYAYPDILKDGVGIKWSGRAKSETCKVTLAGK
ncbi:MAG TPA: hypothetical protein VG733_04425 [Chthoniobacteraceae bacterium]|nr:hypothetical protein [Chthoniobacteraceae bacterium]